MTQTPFTSLTVFPETRELARAASARTGIKMCYLVDKALKEYCKKRKV